jgi:hypothetical protein
MYRTKAEAEAVLKEQPPGHQYDIGWVILDYVASNTAMREIAYPGSDTAPDFLIASGYPTAVAPNTASRTPGRAGNDRGLSQHTTCCAR